MPAGVDTGDRIRLTGEGEAGRNGGPPGDLYVEIHIKEHPIFEREGEHLSCEVPVSFATASLGGSINVLPWTARSTDTRSGAVISPLAATRAALASSTGMPKPPASPPKG